MEIAQKKYIVVDSGARPSFSSVTTTAESAVRERKVVLHLVVAWEGPPPYLTSVHQAHVTLTLSIYPPSDSF